MSARAHSRQRSLSNQRSIHSQPYISKGKDVAIDVPFEPCAATGSLFLYAEGSTVICVHHDTLAVERRFEKHTDQIQFICVDNVSERGQGRLVVTYDVGRTAIVWDLMTGEQVSRFASYEHLTVAAWMRNGNLTFGNEKGELILFEPATSEHVSAHTIFDPVTALAPSADCKTFAIGYRNGSILLASLQPTFTILHTLSTARAPSQISALTWHASASKQKSDMLATNTIDGDLRVWSVAKPPGSAQPRIIRTLHRSEAFIPSQTWISWSKNGRILQLYDGVTWSWDVRTKEVSYKSIPTVEYIKGIAAYGPTGTLFTLGPDRTIQQYDVDVPQMVANVRNPSRNVPQTPPQIIPQSAQRSTGGSDYSIPHRELRFGADAGNMNAVEKNTQSVSHKRVSSRGSHSFDRRAYEVASPANQPERTATSISQATQSVPTSQPFSPSSTKSGRKSSRLRQEVIRSPEEKPVPELFPFTRTRLSDVPYQQPRTADITNLTSDDLRKQMLTVVFGWHDDIHSLIRDELIRHPVDSTNAIILSRWLEEEPNQIADLFRSSSSNPTLDWMRLALYSIGNQATTKKMAQTFTQKLLRQGDIHAAACLLVATGDYNDAIEVYVSNNHYMEAVLLTCLVMPGDWQRQSHLVRKWGEHVVQLSQHHLAVRCFSCTGVEPTEPWTSPTAQQAAQSLKDTAPMLQPSIFHKTMERRGVQDPSPQTHFAPPVSFQNTSPRKNSLGSPDSEGGLKLITSFGKDNYRFPGLMSDEGTPINQALITPIADSAIPRSAISPGGHGSYRMNSMHSIAGALASRTATPSTAHRNRLPSIGETPVDVEIAPFPTGLVPRAPPTPADSGSDKEKRRSGQAAQDKRNTQAHLPSLLTPARYDPKSASVANTPQTAVQSQSSYSFTEPKAMEIERPASAAARTRGSSRTRKPDGLSVNTGSTRQTQPSQDTLQPATYADPIQRPSTASAVLSATRSEFSPPNTGNSLASLASLNSLRSMRSPASISGRSLDQYISSLDVANYHKSNRSRGNSIASKRSRDEYGDKKYKHFTQEADTNRSRSNSNSVAHAIRSPSSPVPMSPGELRSHTMSAESLEAMYQQSSSGLDRADNDTPRVHEGQDDVVSTDSRRRNRSRSRVEGRGMRGNRAPSRHRSPEGEANRRGRSNTPKEGSSTRSPESPVPMIPSEEDLQSAQHVDPAMRFVTANRQRLNRSSSRADTSTDRRATRMRSRSRQPEAIDTSLTRRRDIGPSNEANQQQEDGANQAIEPPQVETPLTGLDTPSATSDMDRGSIKDLQQVSHLRRRELAQAELEARRLSLVRRPSAPVVPLPGQSSINSPPLESPSMLLRSQTDIPVHIGYFGLPQAPRPDSAGPNRNRSQRPLTPRAMKHPSHGHNSVPELPSLNDFMAGDSQEVPALPDVSAMNQNKGRSTSFSSPDIPFDMPTHPAFDASIATSRPASRDALSRNGSPAINTPRDRRTFRDNRVELAVMTIGETDQSDAEVVYATPGPAIVPELQHLAMPPPPPPPPPPPQDLSGEYTIAGLRTQNEYNPISSNNLLPNSTYVGETDRHTRDRSINDKQFVGKFRNLGDRMRSSSRGRSQSHGRDNPSRSPNLGLDDSTTPYESLPAVRHYPLAAVTERR